MNENQKAPSVPYLGQRNACLRDGKPKPKIYCFSNGGRHGWMQAVALAEDGHCLATHICSHVGYMPHDLGLEGSTWKHAQYWNHYPDGFELVWLDEPKKDEGWKKALELCKQLKAERERAEQEKGTQLT